MSGHRQAPPNGVGFTVFAVEKAEDLAARGPCDGDLPCTCTARALDRLARTTPQTPGVSHTGPTAA